MAPRLTTGWLFFWLIICVSLSFGHVDNDEIVLWDSKRIKIFISNEIILKKKRFKFVFFPQSIDFLNQMKIFELTVIGLLMKMNKMFTIEWKEYWIFEEKLIRMILCMKFRLKENKLLLRWIFVN